MAGRESHGCVEAASRAREIQRHRDTAREAGRKEGMREQQYLPYPARDRR